MVHTPGTFVLVDQVDKIFLSIVQRKVLSPNDFDDLDAVVQRLGAVTSDARDTVNKPAKAAGSIFRRRPTSCRATVRLTPQEVSPANGSDSPGPAATSDREAAGTSSHCVNPSQSNRFD